MLKDNYTEEQKMAIYDVLQYLSHEYDQTISEIREKPRNEDLVVGLLIAKHIIHKLMKKWQKLNPRAV